MDERSIPGVTSRGHRLKGSDRFPSLTKPKGMFWAPPPPEHLFGQWQHTGPPALPIACHLQVSPCAAVRRRRKCACAAGDARPQPQVWPCAAPQMMAGPVLTPKSPVHPLCTSRVPMCSQRPPWALTGGCTPELLAASLTVAMDLTCVGGGGGFGGGGGGSRAGVPGTPIHVPQNDPLVALITWDTHV